MNKTTLIMSADKIARSIERLAYQIIEKHGDCKSLAIVGIQRRGVHLAERIHKILRGRLGRGVPLGRLDINLYRDDWTTLGNKPAIGRSEILFDVENKQIILVDDVLYSGRTVRAALEAIIDYGRPARVELLVLIDRGRRELPIQADYVGRALSTGKDEQIDVLLSEQDGRDEVLLRSQG